jgi:4-hydroxy-tetrahydrodipicolinate reductase
MADRIGVAVTGVSGRMGRMLVQALAESDRLALAAAIERGGHPWVGQDLGSAQGVAPACVVVADDPAMALAGVPVAIDFTAPAATLALARAAARTGTALVVGTTGFSAVELDELAAVARDIAVVRAGNMSLGVNLMVALTRRVAAALGPDYDIEIVEAHHRLKVDAPSGTALMLGRAAAEGRGIDHDAAAIRGRDGITGVRPAGGIGYAVLRGGDVVGEHDVVFAGPGERLVLRHVASDRMLFARGALAAAAWVAGRAPGAYDMADVLGLGRA